jgi:hypothetical protein
VLDLTMLIARKEPGRHPRAAARWLLRDLECDEATIDEAALVAALVQLAERARIQALNGRYWARTQ